jgi:SulP family sulfate permease
LSRWPPRRRAGTDPAQITCGGGAAAAAELYHLYSRRLGRIYGHAARPDFIAAVAAMLGVLIFDTLPGLVIGIVVSLLLLLYRASRPHVAELGRVVGRPDQFSDIERHPYNERDPSVGVLRVEAGLFFANAEAVRAAIRARAAQPGTVGVVLDAEAVAFVDITAVRMLDELAEDLAREARRLVIAHDIGQVGDLLAEGASALAVHPTIDEAMAAARLGAAGGAG